MKKIIHYAPSQEDIYKYAMQISSDEGHVYYRIPLSMTTESQKERLSRRFNVPLRILEDEPYLTLELIKES